MNRHSGIALLALFLTSATAFAVPVGVVINVNAGANRHPIDPRVYGAAFASQAAITDLGLTLNRWGGNRATRYNWQSHWGNTANDYCYYNIDELSGGGMGSPDDFITNSKAGGAQPVLTIPMIGWTAKDDSSCSFSETNYPGQQPACDGFHPDCRNGLLIGGAPVVGNNPADSSQAAAVSFEAAWVQHLIDTFGLAAAGGLRYYSLDNEPQLWSSSHRDIHPTSITYAEAWDKMSTLAAAIRAKDAGALITGPEEWEWTALFDSGDDWDHGHSTDRTNHGGKDYFRWMLEQFKAYEDAHPGVRLFDIATVHYYPQGDGVNNELGSDTSAATQLLRNRSTRSLWDPTYVDQSWMGTTTYPGTATTLNGGIPMLIPWMRQQVNLYYPGTGIGVTEYNWGAENHINGATAQADILGILGRENVDMAVRWTAPPDNSPVYNAMKIYRNYDGSHHGFGDVSVSATVPDPDQVSAFAAVRSSDRALTLMLINKISAQQSATINLSGFPGRTAVQRYRLDSGNAIVHDVQLPLQGSSINISLPAQSITMLIVLPAAGDFDGDGKLDVVLRNYSTGQDALWLLNGTTLSSIVDLPALPNTNFRIEGTADFNGDGQTDILLRNTVTGQDAIWLMNGTSVSSIVDLPALTNVNYHFEGTADLNMDGQPDIILRNYATGQNAVWLMNGTSLLAISDLPALPDTAYRIESAGDFNGDGQPDIVLRNYTTGQDALWLMNGTSVASIVDLPALPNTAYRIDAVGDFNGDGKPDIVLRNYTTGQNAVWLMNGTTLSSIVDLPALPNTAYEINGPR